MAGTLVHTQDGLKGIEDIQIGDLILSKDDQTGQIAYKPVVQLFVNDHKQIYNLTTVNEQGAEETVGVTAEHPYWVQNKGWTEVKDLKTGDQLTSHNGGAITVKAKVLDDELHTTYNFEVADFHTYFVGMDGVWVHNVCFGKNFPKKVRKHIDQVRKRYDGSIQNIPSPGKGGIETVKEIIENRISKGGGIAKPYAGEPAVFFPDGNVVYVTRESGQFWTILRNTGN